MDHISEISEKGNFENNKMVDGFLDTKDPKVI